MSFTSECFIITLRVRTFSRLVVYTDGLRLIVTVVVLDTDQVGVGAVVEARPHGQHVFVGLIHSFHQLQGDTHKNTSCNWVALWVCAAVEKGLKGRRLLKPNCRGLVGNGFRVQWDGTEMTDWRKRRWNVGYHEKSRLIIQLNPPESLWRRQK